MLSHSISSVSESIDQIPLSLGLFAYDRKILYSIWFFYLLCL